MTLTVQTAASGVARTAHYILPTGATTPIQTLLTEPQASNLCLQSEDFSLTWSAIGTPVLTAGTSTASGVSLSTVEDDDAAALEGYSQVITFTGNAVKVVSLYVKQGTSTSSVVRLRQTSGTAADRLLATITWSAGVPVVTMTTGTFLRTTALVDGVYRVMLRTTSVTAAETNQIELYPATDNTLSVANTGTLLMGGVQVGNAEFVSSYIKTTTTTATRQQDVLYWSDADFTPRALTVYVRGVNIGYQPHAALQRTVFQLGSDAGGVSGAYFRIQASASSANYVASYRDGTNANSSGNISLSGLNPNDLIEFRAVLLSNAQVYFGTSINGGAETVSTTSAGSATLVSAFTEARLYSGASMSSRAALSAWTHAVVLDGEQTLAQCRAIAGVV